MATFMIVNCADDAQWDAYCEVNVALRHFRHLRPRGTYELPVPHVQGPNAAERAYSLVICGPPGAGKTALLDLLGVPAEARLPAPVLGGDPEAELERLMAYGDLLAARGYPAILEGSVRDTYGPYTHRAVARGFSLTEEFKVKGIRALTAAHQDGGHMIVQLATDAAPAGWTPAYARDIDARFEHHYASAATVAVLPSNESPAELLWYLKRRCSWFSRMPVAGESAKQ